MSAKCSSCGASIIWATSTKGKPMPVDAEPVPNGNLVIERQVGNRVRAFDPLLDAPNDRFVSHFATCPDRDFHRKPR